MALHPDLKILFITPEMHPLIKTGGLGDISAALPAALHQSGMDVRILIPGYPQVMAGLKYKRKIASFADLPYFPASTLLSARTTAAPDGIRVMVIDCPELYQRPGGPYLDQNGQDWSDNALRFGLLSRIGAILASDVSPLAWRPHIAHCNDWQSGLVPAYLHFYQGQKAASVITAHNLAFQGIFPPATVNRLGLPASSFAVDGLEYYGEMSFLKAGLYYADRITTVSPSYAREIQTAPLGFGLQGLLAARHQHISGITNGIDVTEWNPATDPYLAARYTSRKLDTKIANKTALQQKLGLEVDPDIPLLGMVSRLTYQKGSDLVMQIAPQIAEIPAQLVIAGSGDPIMEQTLTSLIQAFPGKISGYSGFDEPLSHLIEAGADCFLMPSRFEPCGLNQMYSQRYGTPPLVHATGGLLDTVVDCSTSTLADKTASGFVFDDLTAEGLLAAIRQVIATYDDKQVWRDLQRNGMKKNFSWRRSATAYHKLYSSLLAER